MTYYKKQKGKYIPVEFAELDSKWTPGLYLIYQNRHSSSIQNLSVQRVHTCKDLGLYADLVANIKDKVLSEVIENQGTESYSYTDIVDQVFISIVNNLENEPNRNQ